jgi:hypothetical protein
MPQNIQQAEFDAVLKKPSSNKAQAKRFLAKYTTPYSIAGITLPENFELKINHAKNAIRLIDRTDFNNPRIAYAVDIEITHEKINHQSCTQVIVWASPKNEELLIGFPRKVFNHLLQHYVIMITDKQQTPDGKRFWERRISQALEDHCFVYYCDKSHDNCNLQIIANVDDFFETYEPLGWGNDIAHQHKLFIISLTPLTP